MHCFNCSAASDSPQDMHINILSLFDTRIPINVYSQHVGGLVDQEPLSKHELFADPLKEYPSKQLYCATLVCPSVVTLTEPLDGAAKSGHFTGKNATR